MLVACAQVVKRGVNSAGHVAGWASWVGLLVHCAGAQLSELAVLELYLKRVAGSKVVVGLC
jgi:hypothetical protein